jgi:hypothetical protein
VSIVLPIVYGAVLVGLFAPRLDDRRLWLALGVWILIVIANAYRKG